MDITTNWLSSKILDLVVVLDRCLSETTFTQDRRLYVEDIASAARWLARLHQGEPVGSVASEILEPSTTKAFTDYWRQGVWGEMESRALSMLQEQVRGRLNDDTRVAE